MRASLVSFGAFAFVCGMLSASFAQEVKPDSDASNQIVILENFAESKAVEGDRELPEILKKQGVFLDQEREVPARAEWNRAIVLKKPAMIMIGIKSADAKGIIVMTEGAFNNIVSGKPQLIDKEKDIRLVDDSTEEVYKKNIRLPAGKYIVMIENRSKSPQKVRLRCGLVNNPIAAPQAK